MEPRLACGCERARGKYSGHDEWTSGFTNKPDLLVRGAPPKWVVIKMSWLNFR